MSDYTATINNRKWNLKLGKNSTIIVDGQKYHYELHKLTAHTYLFTLDNKVYKISSHQIDSETFFLSINTNTLEVLIRSTFKENVSKLIQNKASEHYHLDIKAPMPGMILKIKKKKGDSVQQGDSLLILEAMKMENDIRAPASGIINKVYIKEGNPVEKGMLLISIE